MGWLARLLGGQSDPAASGGRKPPPVRSPQPAAADESEPASIPAATAASGPPLLCWLFGVAATATTLQPAEQQALALLEPVLAQPVLPAELLPRAANVVPQLLALLRQQDLPVPVLAERIGRDPVLAAEVLRQAGGAFFSHLGPVADLPQAIQRLGIEGMQMAIARVVLRPMFQAEPGSLSARTATRLWEHADALARHAVVASRAAGASVFDGYLVGLLHDTGWTVLFHALQRAGVSDLGALSAAGIEALTAHAHVLFGRAAQPWQITPAFAAFAADAQRQPLAQSSHPLAQVLRTAQPACMAELAAA